MKNILLLIPLLVLVACNKGKDPVRASVQTNTGANIAGDFTLTNQCPQGTSGIGAIFDSGPTQGSLYTSAGTFEDRVKALLSANVAAGDVGQISGLENDSTGVRFQGVIKLDTAGNVIAANSKMLIKVYDSFILNSQLDPNGTKYDAIQIEFVPKNNVQINGQFNLQTGEGYVSYRDAYGEVRFEGRLDAQTFGGVVKFQNTKNVNGGAAASGTLGQFKVARCGIIQ